MEKIDHVYMEMAKVWSTNSKAKRLKVGALIVFDKTIISDGYNGTVSGFDNTCEDDHGKTKQEVLHAEANAITKLARSNNSSIGSTLYVTVSPCVECAKLIIQAGIARVIYLDKYRLTEGLELLSRANVYHEQIFLTNKVSVTLPCRQFCVDRKTNTIKP